MQSNWLNHRPPQDIGADGLLQIHELSVSFHAESHTVRAVEDITLNLQHGEILGLVGESGSGKSVTCQALMGLLPATATVEGTMFLDGECMDLADTSKLARLRGKTLSMIFQDPISALDPLMTVRAHLMQRLRRHGIKGESEEKNRKLLHRVGIADYKRVLPAYPHQLSGGLCQRVVIALALVGNPQILIADEPTTALDVTIQAQVLDLLEELRHTVGLSVVFISHDLAVVAEICDRIAVMYGGKIVESGTTAAVLDAPAHPYSEGLIDSRPSLAGAKGILNAIPSAITTARNGGGCSFVSRCRYAKKVCGFPPPYRSLENERRIRCHFPLP